MAGDWIKMRSELQSHPKVVRILSATKADKFRVIGGLHAVWAVFDTHSTDGALFGYTPDLMDHVIGWSGFSAAMQAVNWLLFDGTETLTLPEFDEHNSKGAKRRAEDQKRKRNDRRDADEQPQDGGQKADKNRTREREELEKNQDQKHPLANAGEQGDGVAGAASAVTAGNATEAQANGAVIATIALRRVGMRCQPQDPFLLALVAEGFGEKELALAAAEKALKDASLWNDPDTHPELHELLASGAQQAQMHLTTAQYASIKTAAAAVGTKYLAGVLRGRKRDAEQAAAENAACRKPTGLRQLQAGNGRMKPSPQDSYEGKTYVGTPVDQLPPELRPPIDPANE